MKTLAAAILLTISAHAVADEPNRWSHDEPIRWEPSSFKESPAHALDMSTVKAVIEAQLKDPESARYRNVKQVGDYICGYVNAKNEFGGYVGFTDFLIQGQTVVWFHGPIALDLLHDANHEQKADALSNKLIECLK